MYFCVHGHEIKPDKLPIFYTLVIPRVTEEIMKQTENGMKLVLGLK
jgi:hypothetical protein